MTKPATTELRPKKRINDAARAKALWLAAWAAEGATIANLIEIYSAVDACAGAKFTRTTVASAPKVLCCPFSGTGIGLTEAVATGPTVRPPSSSQAVTRSLCSETTILSPGEDVSSAAAAAILSKASGPEPFSRSPATAADAVAAKTVVSGACLPGRDKGCPVRVEAALA